MKKMLFVLICLFCAGTLVKAQDSIAAKHGGKLKLTGYQRVEVVECYQFLEIYLYDLDMYPVRNYGLIGSVDFYYPDNTCLSSTLYPYGVDGFTAEVVEQCFMSCEIRLHGIGTDVKVSFDGFGESNEDCKKPEN